MIRYLLKALIIMCAFSCIALSGLSKPTDGSSLNYIHILFEWEEVANAVSYEIEVAENSGFNPMLVQSTVSNPYFVLEDQIDWQGSYYWRVHPIYSGGSGGDWIDTFSFYTGSTLSEVSTIEYDPSQYAEGLTIFGTLDGSFSAVFDKSGKEVWNSGTEDLIYYSVNDNHQFFGCKYLPDTENYLPGVEFSITEGIIWQEPNEDFVHHEIIQLPNGNYMGIASVVQAGPIPLGSWTPFYQNAGYIADGVTPEFAWQGDKIIEWDAISGEVVWEWNTFDYLNMADYEPSLWEGMQTLQQGFYEWTHLNALAFAGSDNAIYLSSRHLSRIIKVAYPSGDVVWQMGHEMPSGQVDFGHELGFSFQHSLQILENGNIVFFDNGNLSPLYLGTEESTSRALEISTDGSGGSLSAEIAWEYILPDNLFGFASGNAQKLENGNYLITTVGGNGTTLEVNSAHEIVWKANYSNALLYRANRIRGLYDIDDGLEINTHAPLPAFFTVHNSYPNPFNPVATFIFSVERPQMLKINIYDIRGNWLETLAENYYGIGNFNIHWAASGQPSGIYFIKFQSNNESITKKLILQK